MCHLVNHWEWTIPVPTLYKSSALSPVLLHSKIVICKQGNSNTTIVAGPATLRHSLMSSYTWYSALCLVTWSLQRWSMSVCRALEFWSSSRINKKQRLSSAGKSDTPVTSTKTQKRCAHCNDLVFMNFTSTTAAQKSQTYCQHSFVERLPSVLVQGHVYHQLMSRQLVQRLALQVCSICSSQIL